MKQQLTTILLAALAVATGWSQGVTTPRTPSPAAKLTQTIGISTVTVDYSRPSVRDREIWGSLVPYGWNVETFGAGNPAPWRSGANENTVIKLSHAAKIAGKDVSAGKYGLFFVINKDNTGEVILSKDYRSWGNYWYDPANDQLRANIAIRDHAHTETLTFDFINFSKNSAELVLNWEKKQFPVKIEFAVDEIVMANAEEELKGTTGFSPQGYTSAVNYAIQNDVALDKALVWADKAVAQNKGFGSLTMKATLLYKTGKNAEAEKLETKALEIGGTEAEVNQYGYTLLGAGQHDAAIRIFKLNTERHPESANCWDSLGEGYATKGEKEKAIKAFKKSLGMNPPANVKANSEKYLKQLGAL